MYNFFEMLGKFLLLVSLGLIFLGCAKKPSQEKDPFQPPKELSSIASFGETERQAKILTPAEVDEKTSVKSASARQEKLDPTARNKKAQLALKNAGFYKGAIDGKMGPATKKAIADFQAAKKLTIDGRLGPKTWKKLKTYLTEDKF
jgi:peptidoglycan hydrolase-like protein with peptidoglycan-binding domain